MKKILITTLFTIVALSPPVYAIDNFDGVNRNSLQNAFGSAGNRGELLGNSAGANNNVGVNIFGNSTRETNPSQPANNSFNNPGNSNPFSSATQTNGNFSADITSTSRTTPGVQLNSVSCDMNNAGIFVCEPKRRNSIDPTAPPDSGIGATITSFGNISPPSGSTR